MSVRKIVGLIALVTLLGANVASAQYLANGCTTSPYVYSSNGSCVAYYPYPGSGQVVNGQSVTQGPSAGTNTASGSVLGASTNVPNLPPGGVNMTGQAKPQIFITSSGFVPSAVAVTEGATVTWTNNSGGAVAVQSNSSPFGSFSSGSIPAGGTFARLFDIPGTYTYSTANADGSQNMVGTVVVVPRTSGSVLGASTSASNVPTGINPNGTIDLTAATTLNASALGQRVVQDSIFDNFYDPHNIIIGQGGTITWTNRGSNNHSVIADNGTFASGTLVPNGTYSHVFNVPGAYLYYDAGAGAPHGIGQFGVIVVLAPGQTFSNGAVLGASTGTPNVPNTGAGGQAATNLLLLGASALALLGGALLLRKRFATV